MNLNAIPTIFNNELQSLESTESTIEPDQVANEASEERAKSEIERLNSEIFKLKLDHNTEIQKLKKQIESLKNKLDEKTEILHTARNEIDRKKRKIEGLEEINATLRKNHIVADIANVNM